MLSALVISVSSGFRLSVLVAEEHAVNAAAIMAKAINRVIFIMRILVRLIFNPPARRIVRQIGASWYRGV